MGYPTQKPIALLERIIKASSNKGDIVLDPFCGCGTTIEAAVNLERRFVGIDISSFAIDLISKERLRNRVIATQGIPHDLRSAVKLAKDNPFDFETWAINRLQGFVPNTKQVGDSGVDGRARLAHEPSNVNSRLGVAQATASAKFNLSKLRDFLHVFEREKAAVGCYVVMNRPSSKQARSEVAEKGIVNILGQEYRRMHIWSIQEYFDDRLPQLPVMVNPYTGDPLHASLI